MKISYNPISLVGESLEKSIERLARYGYDGVELVGETNRDNVKKMRGYFQH